MDGGRSERDGSASLYTAGRRTGSSPRAPPAKGGRRSDRGASRCSDLVRGGAWSPRLIVSRPPSCGAREQRHSGGDYRLDATTVRTRPPHSESGGRRTNASALSGAARQAARERSRAEHSPPRGALGVLSVSIFFSVAMSHRSPCRERDGETVPAFDSPLCPSDRR